MSNCREIVVDNFTCFIGKIGVKDYAVSKGLEKKHNFFFACDYDYTVGEKYKVTKVYGLCKNAKLNEFASLLNLAVEQASTVTIGNSFPFVS